MFGFLLPKAEEPPFTLERPRFDQSSFSGRLRHFLDMTDPSTLFVGSAELSRSLTLLEDFARTGRVPEGVSDADMWRARKVRDSTVHPDTGKTVFMPFRMSGFVPFGSVTVVGMLLPHQTAASTAFWQWANQSHNAAVNFANRNASSPVSTGQFFASYCGAVGGAVGVALLANRAIERASSLSAATQGLLKRFVPLPAVATANVVNVYLMRGRELESGITVTDAEGQDRGMSRAAARAAVFDTALTRVFLPVPVLFIPPAVMHQLEKLPALQRSPRLRLATHAAVCIAAFGAALPVAIALFPQQGSIKADNLEPEFRDIRGSDGRRVDTFFYNKGL